MTEDPLAALRPLHVPTPISWWPPAVGWWLLLFAVLVLLIVIYRYWRRMAPQRAALRELKTLLRNPDDHSVATLNQLLKRYALVCWTATTVASLSGKDWLEFLDANGGNGKFSAGPGQILLTDPYKKQSVDLHQLVALARQWIKSNKPGNQH